VKTEGTFLSGGVARRVKFELGDLGRNEVLIETKACGICMGDIYVYMRKLPGGRVMGHEGVGIVLEVGEKVTTLGGPTFANTTK